MIDLQQLQIMYQQWQQGNEDYQRHWADFVEMASRHTGQAQLDIANALQRTLWFQWTREE
jgi:hypothetical protein